MAQRVGVLALQGDFREHLQMLRGIGVPTLEVRLPAQLEQVDRLIIPGGESTAIGKLLVQYGLVEPLRTRAQQGMPVWGTCAGAILMARTISEGRLEGQPQLNLLDISIRRNAFGRQRESFETEVPVAVLGDLPLHGVFIRAPLIEAVGPGVAVLAELSGVGIVAVRQKHLLASSFHPELTDDDRFHRYFLEI